MVLFAQFFVMFLCGEKYRVLLFLSLPVIVYLTAVGVEKYKVALPLIRSPMVLQSAAAAMFYLLVIRLLIWLSTWMLLILLLLILLFMLLLLLLIQLPSPLLLVVKDLCQPNPLGNQHLLYVSLIRKAQRQKRNICSSWKADDDLWMRKLLNLLGTLKKGRKISRMSPILFSLMGKTFFPQKNAQI